MLYPIGIQNFEKIRTGGFVYVDKTAQIYKPASLVYATPEPHPKYLGQCKLLPDGLYVNTGGDTVWRYQHIIQISDRLRLCLKVELI